MFPAKSPDRRKTLAGMNGDQQIAGISLVPTLYPDPMPQSFQNTRPALDSDPISVQDAFGRRDDELDLHDLSETNITARRCEIPPIHRGDLACSNSSRCCESGATGSPNNLREAPGEFQTRAQSNPCKDPQQIPDSVKNDWLSTPKHCQICRAA